MSTYNLPEWVSKYKEKGKTIKVKNGKYYLYESKCIYDKNRKNKHYTKDIYLGSITEDKGFIPAKKSNNVLPKDLFSKTYGPYLLFDKTGQRILDRLIHHFGDVYGKMIFTIAVLRAVENTPYSELDDAYNDSYYSVAYKNLSMSKSSLSDFLKNLSKYKTNMLEFMNEDIDEDDIVIFDGSNLLCGGHNIYTGYGYKHGHNYSSQINELYAYSVKNRKPVYYKLLEGSISDKATLKDVLTEIDLTHSISLIDKGFNSSSNINSLLEKKNKYIMAIRSDSKMVSEEILKDNLRLNANEMFVLNNEAISAYEVRDENDDRICIYFNSTISGIMDAEYVDKMYRNINGYSREDYARKKERFGIYVIKTNVKDFSLEKIYQYYKSRFEIEYMFDTIKNTLGYDKTYMHSDESIESWSFINHISIILTQLVYDILRENNVKMSIHQFYRKLRQVKVIRNNQDKKDRYELEGIPKKVRTLLSDLEIIS